MKFNIHTTKKSQLGEYRKEYILSNSIDLYIYIYIYIYIKSGIVMDYPMVSVILFYQASVTSFLRRSLLLCDRVALYIYSSDW